MMIGSRCSRSMNAESLVANGFGLIREIREQNAERSPSSPSLLKKRDRLNAQVPNFLYRERISRIPPPEGPRTDQLRRATRPAGSPALRVLPGGQRGLTRRSPPRINSGQMPSPHPLRLPSRPCHTGAGIACLAARYRSTILDGAESQSPCI